MGETPADAPQDLDEELEEFEDDLTEVDPEIRELIEALRESEDISIDAIDHRPPVNKDTL